MRLKRIFRGVILWFVIGSASVQAIDLDQHPKVKAVADKLIADGHYTESEIDAIFNEAKVQQSVLDAMMNPAEYKFTWGKYRKLFLQPDRIERGVEFWQSNEAQLSRAEKEYGVPASMIVAIIGVESKFGKFKGKYKVLDSLVSLVTGFPRRSKFFASELEQFLILTKENKLDATAILGSYAGAVGYPQFISSSYRNFAVDFNNDGSTDLIGQVDDAIGSIANYFIENGWKPGKPVTSGPSSAISGDVQALVSRKRKVQHTAADLRAKGAVLAADISAEEKLGVLMLDASEVVHDERSSDTYIVRAGDTLCQIAERFKVSCKKLSSLNKLNARGDIFRGQRLKMPKNAIVSKPPTKQRSEPANTLVKSKTSKWEVARPTKKLAASNEPSVLAPETSKEKRDGPQPIYFYTHHNFYAITQYNHSVLYAMAVYDLSKAIETEYAKIKLSAQTGTP